MPTTAHRITSSGTSANDLISASIVLPFGLCQDEELGSPWQNRAGSDDYLSTDNVVVRVLCLRASRPRAVAALPHDNGDSFDRMPVAQGLAEGWALVSNESRLERYGISRIW